MNNVPTPFKETAQVSATQAVRVDIPHVDTPHYHMSILSRLINQAHKEFLTGLSEHSITCLAKRPERALKIALDGGVAVTEEPDKFVVRSCSDPDVWYTVDLSKRTCTCPDSTLNGMVCKHRIASHYIRQALYADNAFPDPTPLPEHPEVVKHLLSLSSFAPHDFIVYGILDYQGQQILVDVLRSSPGSQKAFVRAMPRHVGGDYKPFFPFPSLNSRGVHLSSAWIEKDHLIDVNVFQSK